MHDTLSSLRKLIGARAVVIGAGISGLSASQTLADHFCSVVLIERDELTSTASPRTGVPQGQQTHAALGGAVKALEELFPGFTKDLADAGAVKVNPGFETLLELPGLGPFPKREWDWAVYSLSRPLLELTIRRRLAHRSNVAFRSGCLAREIVGASDGARGVRIESADGGRETIQADLVVDASRTGALTLSFLAATGAPTPIETTVGVDIRYGTGLFALSDRVLGEIKTVITSPKAPEGVNYGYLVPVEKGCYQLLLVGRGDDIPPTEPAAFVEYARKLSTPTIYNAMQGAKPLSEIARYGFPESKWRHFGLLDHFPRGLIPIGDAICCLNPVQGQGMTVAVQEANILRQLLSAPTATADPLASLVAVYLSEVEVLLHQPWAISAVSDFVYPQTRGQRPHNLEAILKSQLALGRLASRDASVYQLITEVRHLLRPMTALDTPELKQRIEAELAV
jgi:flavin-dependent dehydrogenase